MPKKPLILTVTLPFFVALVLMLSTFTYFFGNLFEANTSAKPAKIKKELAYVLGAKTQALEKPEPLAVTGTAPILENRKYKSFTVNSDGTKTEVYKEVNGDTVIITVYQYDMFGKELSKKTYSDSLSNLTNPTFDLKAVKTSEQLMIEQLPKQLENMGYTYDSGSIKVVKASGKDIYKATAKSKQKVLGLYKVEIPVQVSVDTLNPSVVTVKKSFSNSVLDLISF